MHHYNNIQSIRKTRVLHFYPQVQMTGTDAAEIYIYLFVRRFTMLIVFPTFICIIYRGSYMSAHVLLNLLNELGKIDKMRGLPSILSLFRNEFNKFNNTRARMLDSIYHMTNSLKFHFWRKNVLFCHYVRNVVMDVITFPVNL